jgi:hypothetical protein
MRPNGHSRNGLSNGRTPGRFMEEKAVMAGETELRVQGGLVRIARIDGDKYQFIDDPEPLIANIRQCGASIDIFTFMQRIPESEPKFHYRMEWDNLAAVPLTTFDAWWTKQIDNKTRNMVRRAEKKGIEVREAPFDDDFVCGISEVYNETPIRQGRRFRHYGKNLEEVCKEEGTFQDCAVFIGAYCEGKMIGFAKLVRDRKGTQAGLMNILSLIEQRDKAPTNALIARAVRSCTDRGIPYLVYSNFAYGKKQNDSLANFKQNNGFKQINLPRYYIPLTGTGSVALRLGLHRRWVERVPEPVAAKARELRNLWHNRRLQASTGAS